MEEAFREALIHLAQRQETANLDRRSLQLVVEATAPEAAMSQPTTGISFAKRVYAARKLGRGWATYTNPWDETPSRLARLRDDWTLLAAALVHLPTEQRVTVLRAFVEGLDFGHVASSVRKHSYLERQRARYPAQFEGLTAIPTVNQTSQTTFVVHALEELADCPLEERHRLHAELARAAPADGSSRPDWLLAELGAWVGLQHVPPNPTEPFGAA